MSIRDDPWTRWYEAYLDQMASIRAAQRLASDRRSATKLMVGLLISYMLLGGMVASITVGIVMSH